MFLGGRGRPPMGLGWAGRGGGSPCGACSAAADDQYGVGSAEDRLQSDRE